VGVNKLPNLLTQTCGNCIIQKKAIDEKTFGANSGEVTYFISTSDGDEIYEIENNSAKMLNSEKIYDLFLRRKELVEGSNLY